MFREILKTEIAPLLRSGGFIGTAGKYGRTSDPGDLVGVDFRTIPSVRAGGKLTFLSVGGLSRPMWEFQQRAEPATSGPTVASIFSGTWWRINPEPSSAGWAFDDDASAHACAEGMLAGLTSARGLPALELMLDRPRYIEALRDPTGHDYVPGNAWDLAALQADAGDVDGVEEAIERATEVLEAAKVTPPHFSTFAAWMRARALERSAS